MLKEIGANIKKIRNLKGLTQEELAHLANLDRSYIGKLENGQKNISIQTMILIAKALDVDIRSFFNV